MPLARFGDERRCNPCYQRDGAAFSRRSNDPIHICR
jgi:hypothetical protein